MTREQWDARKKSFLRQLVQEKNDGTFDGDMWDVYDIAQKKTVASAGPRPPKEGVPVRRVFGAWGWLSGKKTAIGAALALLAAGLVEILPYLPEVLGLFEVEAATTVWVVGVVGKVLIGIGLFHKLTKYADAKVKGGGNG